MRGGSRMGVLRWGTVLLLGLLPCGCGGEGATIAGRGVEVRVEAGAEEVEFGRDFPVTVVRAWDADLEPSPWSDGALAPLAARTVEIRLREAGGRVEETRRLRARAFALGAVRVDPIRIEARPRDGGAARTAASDPLAIRVRSTLDPESPGPPELPGEPLVPPRPRWPFLFAAVALLAGGALLVRHRAGGVRAAPPPSVPPTEPPAARAMRRWRSLEAAAPGDGAAVEALYEEAAAILRAFAADAAGVPAAERTTEELAEDPRVAAALGGVGRERLASLLGRCDRVKFARARPGREARERFLGDGGTLLAAGREGGAA